MAVNDLPQRLRDASALLIQAAGEIDRLRCERPVDHPERLPMALDYLRKNPASMLYRGDRSETWWVAGGDAPRVRFSRGEIESAMSRGLLIQKYPDDPRVGIDALQAAPVVPAGETE